MSFELKNFSAKRRLRMLPSLPLAVLQLLLDTRAGGAVATKNLQHPLSVMHRRLLSHEASVLQDAIGRSAPPAAPPSPPEAARPIAKPPRAPKQVVVPKSPVPPQDQDASAQPILRPAPAGKGSGAEISLSVLSNSSDPNRRQGRAAGGTRGGAFSDSSMSRASFPAQHPAAQDRNSSDSSSGDDVQAELRGFLGNMNMLQASAHALDRMPELVPGGPTAVEAITSQQGAMQLRGLSAPGFETALSVSNSAEVATSASAGKRGSFLSKARVRPRTPPRERPGPAMPHRSALQRITAETLCSLAKSGAPPEPPPLVSPDAEAGSSRAGSTSPSHATNTSSTPAVRTGSGIIGEPLTKTNVEEMRMAKSADQDGIIGDPLNVEEMRIAASLLRHRGEGPVDDDEREQNFFSSEASASTALPMTATHTGSSAASDGAHSSTLKKSTYGTSRDGRADCGWAVPFPRPLDLCGTSFRCGADETLARATCEGEKGAKAEVATTPDSTQVLANIHLGEWERTGAGEMAEEVVEAGVNVVGGLEMVGEPQFGSTADAGLAGYAPYHVVPVGPPPIVFS